MSLKFEKFRRIDFCQSFFEFSVKKKKKLKGKLKKLKTKKNYMKNKKI